MRYQKFIVYSLTKGREKMSFGRVVLLSSVMLVFHSRLCLSFLMLKTATIVGGGHRFRTFLNLLASFFHLPVFWKRSFATRCCSSCFHFCSCPLILRYIFLVNYLQARRHCYRKTTPPLSKLLLGKLRTNRERVILPSSQSKIKNKYSLHWPISVINSFVWFDLSNYKH